jgi:hypothetical protein
MMEVIDVIEVMVVIRPHLQVHSRCSRSACIVHYKAMAARLVSSCSLTNRMATARTKV